MKTFLTASSLAVAALLTACGGGSSNSSVPATITSVTPDTIMYGKTVKFTVVGTGLDQNLSMSSATCGSITKLAGGTSTSQIISCVPSATGTLTASFTATGLATAFTSTQTVPVPQVTIKTTMGDMVLELYPNTAPLTVNNFLQYTNDGFYSGLIFHRVIKGFMNQGGGFDATLQQKTPRAAIKLESGKGLSNLRGTIAMARTNVADSATSQFFINAVDNTFLDAKTAGVDGYAVFGKVLTGLEVVDAINAVATSTQAGFADVPVTPIVISGVTQTK